MPSLLHLTGRLMSLLTGLPFRLISLLTGLLFRLISLLTGLFRVGPPPPPDTSRLCRLPLEIFLLVADELTPEGRFLLSRTCRRARLNLHRDWPAEMGRLPADERLRCLLRVAYDLPDYLACAVCCGLHRVRVGDTPTYLGYLHHGHPDDTSEGHHVRTVHGYIDETYFLMHDHVQLALKYTRTGDTYYARYLEDLMKPYSLAGDRAPFIFPRCYEFRCTETPRIVDGRFLHESVWDLRRKYGGPVRWTDWAGTWPGVFLEHFHPLVCGGVILLSKQDMPRPRSPDDYDDFVATKNLAQSVSCGKCWVDFRIRVSYSRWVIHCWRDLGTEIEPPGTTRWSTEEETEHWRYLRGLTATDGPGPIEAMYNK